MITLTQPQTPEEFSKLLETKPASEFINREIIQQPMPQCEPSLLQGELCQVINRVAKPQKMVSLTLQGSRNYSSQISQEI